MLRVSWALCGLAAFAFPVGAANSALKLIVQDADTGAPLTARMRLTNSKGRAIHARKSIGHADFFIVPQSLVIPLPPDTYEFTLEKGPEYRTLRGHFIIERNRKSEETVSLKRIVDLRKEGWWSGDLWVQHARERLPSMMAAEDLQLACLAPTERSTESPADRPEIGPEGPWIVTSSQFLGHPGGDVALLDCDPASPPVGSDPPDVASSTIPQLSRAIAERHPRCTLALRPYASDFPIWIAQGQVQAVSLLNGNLREHSVSDNEDHGRPRDRVLFPPPHGNARWSHKIYTDLLNLGLRLPPVATSESGLSPNPVGYNRVYVHCEGPPTLEMWWQNLLAGAVFVTNGPLLRVAFNGERPGHEFVARPGESVTIECTAELATRDKIEYLQVIQNGEVVHDVRLESLVDHQGKLPPITFDRSGWMMVRATTVVQDTYRAACTGPVYVRIGETNVTPQANPTFWTDWITERSKAVRRHNPTEWPALQDTYRQARDFFAKLSPPPTP